MTLQEKLNDLHRKGVSWDCKYTTRYTFSGQDGFWTPPKPMACHPLELILLGEEVIGTKDQDIARLLEVEVEWMNGFQTGFYFSFEEQETLDVMLEECKITDEITRYGCEAGFEFAQRVIK